MSVCQRARSEEQCKALLQDATIAAHIKTGQRASQSVSAIGLFLSAEWASQSLPAGKAGDTYLPSGGSDVSVSRGASNDR